MVEIAVDRHFHRLLLRHPDQRASRLVCDDAAIIDDGDAIAQLLGLLQIMGGEHDGNALGIEAPDIVPELLAKLDIRSEEHTSELQSLMRISYAVFCLKKQNTKLRQPIQSF